MTQEPNKCCGAFYGCDKCKNKQVYLDKLAEDYLLSSVERNQYGDELSFIDGYKLAQENSNENALEFEIAALKSLIQDMDATIKSKYSEKEVIRFADWILHKRFEMRSDNHQNWWGKFNEEKDYTSKELFEQFKIKWYGN